MFKVKLDIRGSFVKVTVLDENTNEVKKQISESLLGSAEEHGRGIANSIINRMKAKKVETITTIEYTVE